MRLISAKLTRGTFRRVWCHSTAIHVYPTASTVVKHRSTQTGLCPCRRSRIYNVIPQRPVTSLLFGRATNVFQRPWHDPKFMQGKTPEESEEWLLSLLQSSRQKADEKGITTGSEQSRNAITYFDDCFEIDAVAYLRVLEAHATFAGAGSSQKCEYWIVALERHYSAATELFYATYGRRLDAANNISSAKRNRSRSEHEVIETTYSNQREQAAGIVRDLRPTVDCYNAVIEAWASDRDPISVVRSRRWLSKLEDEAKNSAGDHTIIRSPLLPNSRSYDLYLRSCSRGIGKHAKLHKERAEEAERILQNRLSPDATLAIRPNTESFNYVLRAWTRCRNEISVAARVTNLILTMERIQKEFVLADEKGVDVDGDDLSWKRNISPDTKSYAMVLDGWIIKAGIKAEKWRSCRIRTLKSIKNISTQRGSEISGKNSERSANMHHIAQDDGSNEMEKAESILKYIRDLDRFGHSNVRATVIGYNTLLSGWARLANEFRPSIPLTSERILHDMIALAEQGNLNAQPDVTSFNAVIKAWGRTKQANSALRCEFWLRTMIREGGTNFIAKPDVATYNLCMDAHLHVGGAPRVEDLLIEMESTNDVSPNSESYSKVIRAWLDDEMNGHHYGLPPGSGCITASDWLQKLLDKEKSNEADKLGPAPELFAAILKTAARTRATSGERLLTMGLSTFEALTRSRFAVDPIAYAWLLEIALKALSSPKDDSRRAEVVTGLFKRCCDAGLLSSHFLSTLTDGPFRVVGWTKEESRRLCNELLGDPPYASAWSRNLKDPVLSPRSPNRSVANDK